MEDEDTSQGLQPRKASINDEWLQHPASGAFIRNPLRQKPGPNPIVFSAHEYDHNSLDEALQDWHCITVKESTLHALEGQPSSSAFGGSSTRAIVSRLGAISSSFEFVVRLRKSAYLPPRSEGRRRQGGKEATQSVILIDKVNIEVTDLDSRLRIDRMSEGLMAAWNRSNPAFIVRPGDYIVRVNGERGSGKAMVEELRAAEESLRIVIHRSEVPARQSASAESRGTKSASASSEVDGGFKTAKPGLPSIVSTPPLVSKSGPRRLRPVVKS